MKKLARHSLLIGILGFSFSSCGKLDEDEAKSFAQASAEERIVDTAGSAMAGLLDDLEGAGTLALATSSACRPVSSQTCGQVASRIKEVNYSGCARSDKATLSGYVTLEYRDSDCSIASFGQYVTRKTGLTFQWDDIQLDVRSSGATLDHFGSHFELTIAGIERKSYEKSQITSHVSVRTATPLKVSHFARNSRRIQGGSLVIDDRVGSFSARVSVGNELRWQNSCCFPVSGSLNMDFSGLQTGSYRVTFRGCGKYEIREASGKTREGSFLACAG